MRHVPLTLTACFLATACASKQRPTVPKPAPVCVGVAVAGDEVRCGGRPWAKVFRAACAPPTGFPASAFLWPDEVACRGLGVAFADGTRGWVYKAPSLDPAAPGSYAAATQDEAATEWIANATLSSDGRRLTFQRGQAAGASPFEFDLVTRGTRPADYPIPDPRAPRYAEKGLQKATASCGTPKWPGFAVAAGRAIAKFAVREDGALARFELMAAPSRDPRLPAAVWDVVRACDHTPARDQNGNALTTWAVIPFRFQ